MKDEPHKHRDRYDVTENVEAEYVDDEQTVLVNKLGLRTLPELQVAEESALVQAYESVLNEVRTDTPLTCDLLRHIHDTIFGKLFAWAGRWRTVSISKPGITWPPPLYVPQSMEEFEKQVLKKYRPELLKNDEQFCSAVAEIQGEFLVVHPFREGNARTIKLMTDLLALQTGRPLLNYDQSDAGRERYIVAASHAFSRNYEPMVEVIRSALDAATRP